METSDKLSQIRHTLAHVLATAVLQVDPDAKLAIGPVIDNGFYYDFEFSDGRIQGEADLPKLTKRMKKIIQAGFKPVCSEISVKEAKEKFADQPYKLELIEELAKEEKKITIYTIGDFVDLCEGPHVENSKEISDAFKLDRIAGAYWRGDEKNKMLTRIYGLSFETKKDLDAYTEQIEEAKKRDHRKLGKELDLFTFSELIGPGLPLWTPRGTLLRNTLDNFVWELRKERGYEKVTIPHITKKDLYETSGHWSKFSDELFKVQAREGKEYALKPMNCPHHTQIFNHLPRSYKAMPQRYCETTMVYRDEQSGELGGLSRVLSITQDDAHVFCRKNQIKDEFFAIWDIVDTFYKAVGFKFSRIRLSFHDPENFDAYLGTKEIWSEAENALREIAKERGVEAFEAIDEAAMYGPKIDFMACDSLGREHQVATIQLDMNLPERFDLVCTNEKGEKERIVMLHAAIMGSIERFLSVLIEHYAGNFPLWLSPVQIKVLPIAEAHHDYAKEVFKELDNVGFRVELDLDSETLGRKIRQTKIEKIPYFLVIGDKEVEDKKVTLESRGDVDAVVLSREELIDKLKTEIEEKK